LFIGEIGDNKLRRTVHVIYRVAEPTIVEDDKRSSRSEPRVSDAAVALRFSYPGENRNAETLLVHPVSGDVYVLSKRLDGPSDIYRVKPEFDGGNATVLAEKIGELKVPAVPNGQLTGGDISPDGKRVILCDYANGYELSLPDTGSNFDDIWRQPIEKVDLGKRPAGEAVCYSADGSSVFANSEKVGSPLNQIVRKPDNR
jgi:hypothetical protein